MKWEGEKKTTFFCYSGLYLRFGGAEKLVVGRDDGQLLLMFICGKRGDLRSLV